MLLDFSGGPYLANFNYVAMFSWKSGGMGWGRRGGGGAICGSTIVIMHCWLPPCLMVRPSFSMMQPIWISKVWSLHNHCNHNVPYRQRRTSTARTAVWLPQHLFIMCNRFMQLIQYTWRPIKVVRSKKLDYLIGCKHHTIASRNEKKRKELKNTILQNPKKMMEAKRYILMPVQTKHHQWNWVLPQVRIWQKWMDKKMR